MSSQVLFTAASSAARLIGRYSGQVSDSDQFNGYEFDLAASGSWQLTINADSSRPRVLAFGSVPAVAPDSWHSIALRLKDNDITATVDGVAVAEVADSTYQRGLAGIGSNWTQIQFNGLTIR